MIETKPEVSPAGLYNQRQAAEALQVERHTIARYAKSGLIKFQIRKAGFAKVTKGSEIIKCWSSTFMG